MYKVIVAGSRSIKNYPIIEMKLFDYLFNHLNIEIVSGTARGVDKLGERFANKYDIPLKQFPADWDKYGKSAGYKRNEQMAKYADALVAFWDGESKGTKHMIDLAKKYNLDVEVIKYNV